MLQERDLSPESEGQPSPTSGGAKPPPRLAPTRVSDGNPSLLPDAVYFSLRRMREAEAKVTVRLTNRDIERGLRARLNWPL